MRLEKMKEKIKKMSIEYAMKITGAKTHSELARRMNVSRQAIWKWNNEYIPMHYAQSIIARENAMLILNGDFEDAIDFIEDNLDYLIEDDAYQTIE